MRDTSTNAFSKNIEYKGELLLVIFIPIDTGLILFPSTTMVLKICLNICTYFSAKIRALLNFRDV